MTAAESILLALYADAGTTGKSYTEADIVVLAFRADPRRFGMVTYPGLPDSKRVAMEMFKKNNPLRRWLTALPKERHNDPGLYRLSSEGIDAARRLSPRREAV